MWWICNIFLEATPLLVVDRFQGWRYLHCKPVKE